MRTAIVFALVFMAAGAAYAQTASVSGEAFVTLALADVFRVEDRTFGNRPDIGGGLRLPLARRIGLEFEANRALGLRPEPAPCGLLLGCVGTAREGLLDATLATANVYVRFPRGGVEPYIVGGAGILWTRSATSMTVVRDGVGVMSEVEHREHELAISVGAGIDVPLTRRFSVRPEFRIYDSNAVATMNLTVFRAAVAAGWRW